jgi:hypothetical protein
LLAFTRVAVAPGGESDAPEFMGTHQRLMRLTQELHARQRAARLQGS